MFIECRINSKGAGASAGAVRSVQFAVCSVPPATDEDLAVKIQFFKYVTFKNV